MDGLALVTELRRTAGPRCVAVALSGYCQAEDRDRALAAGFDYYLIKPASAEKLLALIGADPALAAG
jgi:CheY-like chemotaxis protein